MKRWLSFFSGLFLIPTLLIAENFITFKEGAALLDGREFKKLEAECSRELNENPKSLKALFFLYMLNEMQKNTNGALKYRDQFESVFRSRAEVLGSVEKGFMVILAGQKRLPPQTGDVEVVQDSESEQLDYIPIYYAIASKYLASENCKEGLYWLNAAKYPTNNDEYYLAFQGYCNYNIGRYHVSRNYYTSLLPHASNRDIVLYSIAATYANEGNIKMAVKWLEDAFKENRNLCKQAAEDKDGDFNKIGKTSEFQELIKKYSR